MHAVGCTCGTPEEWRPVGGWPYLVSSHGRVRRVGVAPKNGYLSSRGYPTVALSNGPGNVLRAMIHRLVAFAFFGPAPSDAHQVNHLDGNKAHNCTGNLEWATPSRNAQHAYDIGLRSGEERQGEKHPLSKLTEEIVVAARREYLESDVLIKDLARKHGVTAGCMQDAVKGTTWGHIPGAVRRRVVRCAS